LSFKTLLSIAEALCTAKPYGMRNGSFTGKKLSDYITGGGVEYKNARRIINGLDQTLLIKKYAENIKPLSKCVDIFEEKSQTTNAHYRPRLCQNAQKNIQI